MKTLNDSPARYAAQLAETIGSLHRHLAAEQPDWWQKVVAELHSRLDKEFPPFYECEECGHKFNQGADVIPPWKGGSAPIEQPDFLRLPEMAPTRMNLLDWRQNGFEERLGELEAHSLPYRMDTLEAFLDFDPQAPADDALPDSIHDLIADGMTGVTTHCMEHAAALVTVEAAAVDNRIDAIAKQAELLANLLNSVKALVLNIDARLEALESKAPC